MKTFTAFLGILLLVSNFNASSAISSDSIVSETRNNSIHYELFGYGLWSGSVNYERTFSFSSKAGISLRAGLAYYEKLFPVTGINLLLGSRNRYLETGFAYTAFHEGNLIFLGMGYRYQGNKGFLFRAVPLYSLNQKFFWFGISFGYSF